MKFDIENLSEGELIELSNRIVARLRFLNQMRVHSKMADFRIGDRVTFPPMEYLFDMFLMYIMMYKPQV